MIGSTNHSENDGVGDLHRQASFRALLQRADPDKVHKPSDMACSRFPNTIFSSHVSDLAFQLGLLDEASA